MRSDFSLNTVSLGVQYIWTKSSELQSNMVLEKGKVKLN